MTVYINAEANPDHQRVPDDSDPIAGLSGQAIGFDNQHVIHDAARSRDQLPNLAVVASPGCETAPMRIKDMLFRLNGVFPMDEAVKQALPKGSIFVSVERCAESAWTITGRIETIQEDGMKREFFVKVRDFTRTSTLGIQSANPNTRISEFGAHNSDFRIRI
ncbi:hypothetical protein F5Y15DRAFT_177684 [Xylariaceae sp. FL0016]|nr:hypothetical protein F5Y15DRAFT_177684 [Xylariaceae sp. FL0016]